MINLHSKCSMATLTHFLFQFIILHIIKTEKTHYFIEAHCLASTWSQTLGMGPRIYSIDFLGHTLSQYIKEKHPVKIEFRIKHTENSMVTLCYCYCHLHKIDPSLLQDVIHELAKKLGYRSRDIGET